MSVALLVGPQCHVFILSDAPSPLQDSHRCSVYLIDHRPIVLDVLYQHHTALQAWAASSGCVVLSGVDMLFHQACAQQRLWTLCPAPAAAMRAALTAALLGAGSSGVQPAPPAVPTPATPAVPT